MRNHNAFELTSAAVMSLEDISYENKKITVVDDASTDSSGEKLVERFPNLKLIKTDTYVEYCIGLNIGIRDALAEGAEYIFVVNNDTKDFSSDYLDVILRAFERDEKIGLIGSAVFDYDHQVLWDGSTKIKLGVPMNTPTEGYVIRSAVFREIGLLDEGLVRYFEDLDFLIRMRRAGFKTHAIPTISFMHLCGGTSSKQAWIPNFYRSRNLIWFIKKYRQEWSLVTKIRYWWESTDGCQRAFIFLRNGKITKAVVSMYAFMFGSFMGLFFSWK
jgi:GT2 family glycosyltransferase